MKVDLDVTIVRINRNNKYCKQTNTIVSTAIEDTHWLTNPHVCLCFVGLWHNLFINLREKKKVWFIAGFRTCWNIICERERRRRTGRRKKLLLNSTERLLKLNN